ncbi:MAG: hypothetical protein ACI36W_00350 [Coriobacteriales bacterium]
MNNVILCESSALEFFRKARLFEGRKLRGYGRVFGLPQYYCASDVLERTLSRSAHQKAPSCTPDELAALAEELELSLPLHVLVPDKRSRRNSSKLLSHVFPRELGERCSHPLGGGAFVCRPELMLFQLARLLDELDLIRLICELSSCYVLDESSPHGMIEALPLIVPGQVAAFCMQHRSQRGAGVVSRCCGYAVPNTASPMESALALVLTLPHRLGGYALPKPQANGTIRLSGLQQHVSGTCERRGDLLWPLAKLAVEYDSDQEHLGSEKLLQDTQRRNALLFKGYTVITVTKHQLYSIDEMDKVAINISKQLGKRIRPTRLDWCYKQEALFERLLGERAGGSRRRPSVIAR